MAQLRREEPALTASGASLHVIGNGTPNFLAGFRETTGYAGPLFTDPDRRTYKAADFVRSIRSGVNLRTARAALRALAGGNRQSSVQGDAWQQGGVLVVSPKAEVLWAHRDDYAGDLADARELERAVAAAVASISRP